MLRLAASAALLFSLAGAGCASSAGAPDQAAETTPEATVVDGTVRLAVGGSTTFQGHTVRLVEVVEDSRCPTGAQCITEGVARIRVEVDRQSVVLTVPGARRAPGDVSSATVGGLAVAVTALEPYPDSDRTTTETPVASLTLN